MPNSHVATMIVLTRYVAEVTNPNLDIYRDEGQNTLGLWSEVKNLYT